MSGQFIEIVNITSCELPIASQFKRISPRKESLKPQDYDEKFDSDNLFCRGVGVL